MPSPTQSCAAANLSVRYQSKRPITKAELNYTRDTGKWQDRKWTSQPATLNKNTATAAVPSDARAWYINLFDDRGLVVSSEHETRE